MLWLGNKTSEPAVQINVLCDCMYDIFKRTMPKK